MRRIAAGTIALLFILCGAAQALDRVVIDPGHGGFNKGGSYGTVYEKHLALDVARRLEIYLKRNGVQTVMTRTRDNYISLPGRVEIGNRYRDAVFVSIHFNWASNSRASGLETFYCGSAGNELANYIHASTVNHTRASNRGVKFARFHVLRHSSRPACLVECGFLSNSSERRKCLDPGYRQRLAEGIGRGLVYYLKRH
ncbi:MAG: N-acetylmuramoyl-L-alanine amidase [Verrucomicrobiales bacterium]